MLNAWSESCCGRDDIPIVARIKTAIGDVNNKRFDAVKRGRVLVKHSAAKKWSKSGKVIRSSMAKPANISDNTSQKCCKNAIKVEISGLISHCAEDLVDNFLCVAE